MQSAGRKYILIRVDYSI